MKKLHIIVDFVGNIFSVSYAALFIFGAVVYVATFVMPKVSRTERCEVGKETK